MTNLEMMIEEWETVKNKITPWPWVDDANGIVSADRCFYDSEGYYGDVVVTDK